MSRTRCSTFSVAMPGIPSQHCNEIATHRVKGVDMDGRYSELTCERHARYLLLYHPDMYQTSERIDDRT